MLLTAVQQSDSVIHIYTFFLRPHCVACVILVPWPGIEPMPPAVEAWSLNHWTAREVLTFFFVKYIFFFTMVYHCLLRTTISWPISCKWTLGWFPLWGYYEHSCYESFPGCVYIYIFYFWLSWVLAAAHGLSLVAVSGGYSSLQCAGFSLQWLLLLWSMVSRCAGFRSCGTWAQ